MKNNLLLCVINFETITLHLNNGNEQKLRTISYKGTQTYRPHDINKSSIESVPR